MSLDRLAIRAATERFDRARILVLGDYCLDKYLYIDPALDELSVETGLTAYQVIRKALYAGAAGTVTGNLRALGAQVDCVGLVGEDGEGFELLRCLEAVGANTGGLVRTGRLCTNTYTKPMRRQDDGSWIELNRLDFRSHTPTPPDLEAELLARLDRLTGAADAVMVCDQFIERNCAVVTDRVRARLADLAEQHPDKLFYVDSRGSIGLFRSCVVKCNHLEALRCAGLGGHASVEDCALALYRKNRRPVVITRGEHGSLVCDGAVVSVPAVPVEGPVDICGAGDANSAGFVLGRVCGLDNENAAYLANCVSSVTIRQLGVTGTASPEQVRALL